MLGLSNYVAKNQSDDAIGVYTCNLAAENDFISLKAGVEKLDFNKLVNVSINLNNLKTKEEDLVVDKLKTVPIDLKKLSDVVYNDIVKNAKVKTPKAKLNGLEKENPDENLLIHINEYNTDKENVGDVDKRIPDWTSYVIHKFDRKVSRKGAVRVGKRFNLSISNKDMNDIIRIKK